MPRRYWADCVRDLIIHTAGKGQRKQSDGGWFNHLTKKFTVSEIHYLALSRIKEVRRPAPAREFALARRHAIEEIPGNAPNSRRHVLYGEAIVDTVPPLLVLEAKTGNR